MQMGDIYSAAHLTVVAAAGSNPAYGLPGVLPNSRKHPRQKVKNPVRIYEVPQTSGFEDVAMSTWASRAWTYQENFLSRRRLVFTDRQVMYVCNTSTYFEATTKPYLGMPDYAYPSEDAFADFWFPQRKAKDGRTNDQSPMSRAQNYLSGYSARTLRFDSDALYAIAGALNTLTKEGVYHLWAVPVCVSDLKLCSLPTNCDHGFSGEIALAWYHPKPCRRRSGFPTWSPLGWDGRIEWANSEEPQTIEVKKLSVLSESKEPGARLKTTAHILTQGPHSEGYSHSIDLEVQMVAFVLFQDTSRLRPLKIEKGLGVKLLLGDTYSAIFWPHWDLPQSEVEGLTALTGVFFPSGGPTEISGRACVVLQKVQDHYERVGIFWVGVFPHEAAHGWDRQAESQVCDDTFWCLNNIELNTLIRQYEDSGGSEWWQRFTRRETITIQ